MATRSDIEATYDSIDELFRSSLGDHADITCARFAGDFSLTLEQAQAAKHEFILAQTGFRPGARVIDVGCGWGGFLRAVRERGGFGVGLTLSPAQARLCRSAGLDVRLRDWREAEPSELGRFDSAAAVGSLEHFASEQDHLAGRQDAIYAEFFRFCRGLIPPGGRLFLQTMTWGERVPEPARIRHDAPRGSAERLLAGLRAFYPGSWPPAGLDQIAAAAAPCFRLVCAENGRADYIETIGRWNRRLMRPGLRKLGVGLLVLGRLLREPDGLIRLRSLLGSYNRECFRRRVMDHQRIVLEAIP